MKRGEPYIIGFGIGVSFLSAIQAAFSDGITSEKLYWSSLVLFCWCVTLLLNMRCNHDMD